jgi:hypothetical protein
MKKILFTAMDEYFWNVAPKPFPTKQVLPKWWKEMTPYNKNNNNPDGKKLIVENFISNATFKKCTPMLDVLTSGYIIPLWADVQIRQTNANPLITWRVEQQNVFEVHGESSNYVETPDGYHSQVFKYINGWIPKTPKGYSYLVVQPFGYKNLPFTAVPAIVDGDKSTLQIIPPVWVKKDFEGVVEKGTPMVQIIPFKRDNWKSEFDYYKNGEYDIIEEKNFNSTLINHYIKNHWSKKDYK